MLFFILEHPVPAGINIFCCKSEDLKQQGFDLSNFKMKKHEI
jgi:hypothetical protein